MKTQQQAMDDWKDMCDNQCLTKEFVRKHIEHISLYSLLQNSNTPFFAVFGDRGRLTFIDKCSVGSKALMDYAGLLMEQDDERCLVYPDFELD